MSKLTENWPVLGDSAFTHVEVQYPSKVTIRVGSVHAAIPVVQGHGGDLELNTNDIQDAIRQETGRTSAKTKSGIRPTDVPLAPFRIEALRQVQGHEVTWTDIARRAGYMRTDRENAADVRRLKRDLGVYVRGERPPKLFIRYETAERLAEALSLDPVDLGF